MTSYARQLDSNHVDIKAVFQKMLHGNVTDSRGWGQGAGDLLVSYGDYMCFIEIKKNSKEKLTKPQQEFVKRHPHNWHRCETTQQAIDLCGMIRKHGLRS